MPSMEARTNRDMSIVAAVRTTMVKQVQERTVRILFGVATAAVFHGLTGVAAASVWLLAFLLLQTLEILMFPRGRIRNRTEAQTGLGLILLSNAVFASFPVLLAAQGGIVGVAIGVLMIGGALIHAVLASGSSRLTAVVAASPPLIAFVSLPMIMMAEGLPGQSILMLSCAGLMLCWAAFGAWRRVSGDMIVLDKARHDADRANQAKSDFLTMVSHEIRTPLNGVMGMAQSLARDPLTVNQRDRLETLISSGQGLHDLIAEVLDLSRIEAGLLPLNNDSFDLRDTVTRSIEPFMAIASAKGLEISVSLCPGLASAYLGDPVRIRQVLHNLISNAVQLTDAGDILISASRDADGVRLSVCDSGRGVPDRHLARIFDKYALLDPAATRADGGAGLGLGLFMANELTVRMGGSMTATNRIPSGLCLTAGLPLVLADMTRADFSPTSEPLELPKALRVLAAEDHPVNRKILTLLLDQINVVPTMVENGLLAVQACRDEDWDLVLMDIQMPVLDGVSAARQIGQDALAAGRSSPPIIAVTANVMAHQLQEYADAGMALYVPKPIEAGALFRVMQEALDCRAQALVSEACVAAMKAN